MDTRLNYQFITVKDSISGDVWAGFYDSARVETLQEATVHDNLSTISPALFDPKFKNRKK